jgi:class 3 adenylate cyclase
MRNCSSRPSGRVATRRFLCNMPKVNFESLKSEPKEAIVVSFDLSGFSAFCNHPNAHVVIPRFVSDLFEELNRFFMGVIEDLFASGRSNNGKLQEPNFIKYTGDGAIMIWLANDSGEFSDQFCTDLVIAMRALQTRIAIIVPEWEKKWRVVGLPRRARFGISAGLVYALREPSSGIFQNSPADYVGYCINLAVRLQDHCREVGFLVHETVHPNISGLVRLEALGMKGTQVEPVLAFETDLKNVVDGVFKTKFRRS